MSSSVNIITLICAFTLNAVPLTAVFRRPLLFQTTKQMQM